MSDSHETLKLRNKRKEELSIGDIFRILYRRKYWLICSVILLVSAAYAFNKFTKPVYESAVLLKKDKTNQEKADAENLKDILQMQSQDEIETEMELVRTREVLHNTASNLSLFITVDKVINSDGSIIEYNCPAAEYAWQNLKTLRVKDLPEFKYVKRQNSSNRYYFYVKKLGENSFGLFDSQNDSLLTAAEVNPANSSSDSINFSSAASSVFNISEAETPAEEKRSTVMFEYANNSIEMDWTGSSTGKRVYFYLNSYPETIESLKKSIKVDHVVKTDIFKIAVKNTSPYLSYLIANKLAEEYREIRINQQKSTIRYSFRFIDKQLQEVWGKLKAAERDLSRYKSANQITSIDDDSRSLINFLSSLEAEKIKTNLELAEKEDKLSQMQSELNSKGYIDETYLTPQAAEQSGSPFANLLRQLSDLEIQRIEMLQRRRDSHPDVVTLDKRIAQVKDKLQTYNKNTISAYQILINSAKKKRDELNSLTAKYTNRIESLPGEESRLSELIRQKNVYDKIFALLLNQREQMRMAELTKLQDIIIIDQAHIPVKPVYPVALLNLLLGLVAGVIIGFAAIITREFISRRYVDIEEVETEFSTPIFAIIPGYTRALRKKINGSKNYSERFVAMMSDQDGFRETYRVLRAKINSRIHAGQNILMFTSCEENTGKTSIVANLGISLANANKKVLLIDFDLKKATLSKTFSIKPEMAGLISYLENGSAPSPSIYSLQLGQNGEAQKRLDILPAGGISEKSGDIISQHRMKSLLAYINLLSYDYILVDTPPVTRVSDVLTIGRYIKNALLVIRPEWTFRDALLWGIKEMDQEKISIHGIIVNACDIKKSTFRYRYGYGYGYAENNAYKKTSA